MVSSAAVVRLISVTSRTSHTQPPSQRKITAKKHTSLHRLTLNGTSGPHWGPEATDHECLIRRNDEPKRNDSQPTPSAVHACLSVIRHASQAKRRRILKPFSRVLRLLCKRALGCSLPEDTKGSQGALSRGIGCIQKDQHESGQSIAPSPVNQL